MPAPWAVPYSSFKSLPGTAKGKVTAVANEIGLLVLSVGKDDGVEEGDEFTISRTGEFVATVRIDRTDRKWSAGKASLKKLDPRVADDAVRGHVHRPVVHVAPTPAVPADELRKIRKELDEVRSQVRELSDRLILAWQDAGVSADEVSEELRSHLGILRGLVVRRVREGSPAERAGLKVNDVIPDLLEAQLLEGIRTGVPLNVIRKGQPLRLAAPKSK